MNHDLECIEQPNEASWGVDMPELSAALPIGLLDCAGLGEVGPGLLVTFDSAAGLPPLALGAPGPDGEAPGEPVTPPVKT